MNQIMPGARPVLSVGLADMICKEHKIPSVTCVLIGIREFFKMGAEGNERGVYDDAIFVFADSGIFGFNANCDPQSFRPGIASLQNGLWTYRLGIHGLNRPKDQRYKALVQAAPVTVNRDGAVSPDMGWFGINIHRGSRNSVSSLGCQTIHPDQWQSFISTVEMLMKRHKLKTVHYILMNSQGLR